MKEKIQINGTNYLLDTKQAEKLGVLKRVVTYQVGQKFKQGWHNRDYLLCDVGDEVKEVILICLDSGRQWHNSAVVGDYDAITQEEFDEVAYGDREFTLIK